jgi:hypothetical protein
VTAWFVLASLPLRQNDFGKRRHGFFFTTVCVTTSFRFDVVNAGLFEDEADDITMNFLTRE